MAATELALNNPLIDEYTLQGAKGLLVNITGGAILTFEVEVAVNKIRAEVDPEAELILVLLKMKIWMENKSVNSCYSITWLRNKALSEFSK